MCHSSFRIAMLSITPSLESCNTCKLSYHLAIGLFLDRMNSQNRALFSWITGLNYPYCTPKQGYSPPS